MELDLSYLIIEFMIYDDIEANFDFCIFSFWAAVYSKSLRGFEDFENLLGFVEIFREFSLDFFRILWEFFDFFEIVFSFVVFFRDF